MAEISGTITTSGTEWSLFANTAGPTTQTTDATIEVFLDLSDLSGGDMIEVRVYEKVTSGGSQLQIEKPRFYRAGDVATVIGPHRYRHGYDITAKAISGTPDLGYSLRD